MLKRLHQSPNQKLEHFALLFFAVALVFTITSFVQPWRGAYQQGASTAVGFASIFNTSVYELGSSSSQVTNNELNGATVWDAWTSYVAGVMYPQNN